MSSYLTSFERLLVLRAIVVGLCCCGCCQTYPCLYTLNLGCSLASLSLRPVPDTYPIHSRHIPDTYVYPTNTPRIHRVYPTNTPKRLLK